MRIPDHLTCLLRNLYAGQEEQLKLDMEQQTGSKQENEYIKAVYCHPAYLTYMQSTSCLENPRDGGAWWADVYGVTQSRT